MPKRKREQDDSNGGLQGPQILSSKKQVVVATTNGARSQESISIQVMTGSYHGVLHGIIATVPISSKGSSTVHFQDNFLFNAHSSAMRCLAISPPNSNENKATSKVMLATGGTDEKINIYSVATSLPDGPSLPTLSSVPSLENPNNKELGALTPHTSSVNVLHFPSRSKLMSGSDDNTIAFARTRDWTVLTNIKAPMPKIQGRPSGDTAPPGGTPAGVSDFAVHPSGKLMISVGKGEKCMRLWDLVRGKRAGVLNFERNMLISVGEDQHSRGEGQKIVWNHTGDEFAIAFDKGVAVFGKDCEIKCVAIVELASHQASNEATKTTIKRAVKVHQIRYIKYGADESSHECLAVSTEDGRVVFYNTTDTIVNSDSKMELPSARLQAFLGGKEAGVVSRIKDFQVVLAPESTDLRYVITTSSDGAVAVWQIKDSELLMLSKKSSSSNGTATNSNDVKVHGKPLANAQQIGTMLGKYETLNRITCMAAFLLKGSPDQYEGDDDLEDFAETSSDATSESEEDEDRVEEEKDFFEGFE